MAILRLFKKNKKGLRVIKTTQAINFIMVPELGIEPRCPCERGILRPKHMKGGWSSNHPFFFLDICYALTNLEIRSWIQFA